MQRAASGWPAHAMHAVSGYYRGVEATLSPRVRRVGRAFANAHLLTKLILIYAVVMLVPTTVITFTAVGRVRSSVSREVEEAHRNVVRQVASNIDARIAVAADIADSIAFNHRLRSFLLLPFALNAYTLNVYMGQVAPLVDNALTFHSGSLHKVTVYIENPTIPEHWRMFLHASRLRGVPWYDLFVASGLPTTHVYPNTADHVPLNQSPDLRRVLTWVRRVETVDGRYLGLVTLDLLESDVFAPVMEAADGGRRFVVSTAAGHSVYAPAGDARERDATGLFSVSEPIAQLGLHVRGEFPADSLHRQATRATGTMLVAAFIGFLLSVGLAYLFLRIVFRKVNTMVAAMHTVASGDLSVRVPVTSDDELGEIARDFNGLIERINGLIDRVVVEERDKQQAQLAALQFQINPHFVYNTIDLFRMRMELDGSYETADAVTSFGKMVRYSFTGDSMYATVEAELEHVRNFVALQSIRGGARIRLKIDCPSQLLSRSIMKLVLQPIVENSVLHGLRDDGTELSIAVAVRDRRGLTVVEVSDDGAGMSAPSLRELRKRLSCREITFSARESAAGGIGLANIAGRLRLFYGEAASLRIVSKESHGTRLTVTVPQ
ncbi:MAG: sensor histidine kinase [Spirochaetaceae bacterium]|nr:MAG: sensor histidine kinase [Spirochaetaceae bacterium]